MGVLRGIIMVLCWLMLVAVLILQALLLIGDFREGVKLVPVGALLVAFCLGLISLLRRRAALAVPSKPQVQGEGPVQSGAGYSRYGISTGMLQARRPRDQAGAALLPVAGDVLFCFGQSALHDQVSVVRLASGDLVGDGGAHGPHDLLTVVGVRQHPGKLHQRGLG